MNAESKGGGEALLFPVSISKLAVMSVCTLGFYELYWMHANWVRIRNRGLSISPARRTLFALLFCYPLFRRMRVLSVSAGGRSFPAALLVLGWVITACTGRFLPAPYSLLSLLGFVFFVPVQASANQANALVAPEHHRNSRLTVWNWLLVVPFGLLVSLAIIGAFVGKQ
jgi:hypothetical protein